MSQRRIGPLSWSLVAVLGLASLPDAGPAGTGGSPQEAPLRVYLRTGPKTHGEGQHDHPRFLAEWTPLLTERGCSVRGSLEFPGEADLEASDVLVIFAAEGASIHGEERERLQRFQARGGGLVVLHDGVCGDDPHWFKTVAGGAWEHGRSKYFEGDIGLCVADHEHPITSGVANFDFKDEIYWDLHLDPDAHVLANAFHTPFDVTPQMWVLERDGHRSFVSLQGHEWVSFSNPAWRTLLLRGIAWAGRRDVDALVTPAEVAALRYPEGGPRAPERAAEALVLHPDFELNLVAAEPLVINPVSLDWDARGRMWVALTPGYPDKQEFSGVPAHDSIVILSDADGDGRMDASQTFAEGLDLVTSLVFHQDGVIVTQAPEILFLRDTDGDDRADQREVLYRGFGYGDTHAVTSNLRWGPDGWIYGTQGYSGGASRHILGKDGQDHGHIGNGLFRFRPDGSAIEMVSSYGSNTWGLDFRWDGELLFTMANGSHLRHVVLPDRELAFGRMGKIESWLDVTDHDRAFPLRSHERPPYQQIDFVGGFTAAAGCCLYEGGAWGEEYAEDHFVCEPTINLVHRDALAERGVTFGASKPRQAEFLGSTDLWFRPVHLRVGPDAALYVLDLYNQASVHNDTRGPQHGPTNAAVRPDRDHLHGRIWRIQKKGARPEPVPALYQRPVMEQLAALEHSNGQVRGTAERLLCERELDAKALEAVAERAVNALRPWGRVEALWILARRDPARLATIASRLLRDPEPGVRKSAYAALGTLDEWNLARALPRAGQIVEEQDPRAFLVALECARSLLGPADYPALLERYQRLEDDWSRSAVLAVAGEQPAAFLDACLALTPTPELSELERALAAGVARRGDLGQAVEAVRLLGERSSADPRHAALFLRELGARIDKTQQPWSAPRMDEALIRLAGREPEVALAALPFCERWGQSARVQQAVAEAGRRLGALVASADQPLDLRLRSLEAMLDLPAQRAAALELVPTFLDPLFPPEVQLSVIEAVGRVSDPEAARVLCASLGGLARGAREQVQARLLERPEWTGVLLDFIADESILTTEIGPQGLHRLRNHPDAGIAQRAGELLDRLGNREQDDKEALLAELTPLVDRPGDPLHGRAVFEQNCGNCHTVQGVETRGGVGPDLTGMGAHGARELLPFMIDPNRSVEPAYLEYVLQTLDGRLIDGVIVRETPQAIVLRNSSGEAEVPRSQVAELRSSGRSPMPTGFESLGAESLRDLISFLAGEWAGYRVLDLRPYVCASATRGLYDTKRDAHAMRFRQYGVVGVEGIPFEVLDPARMDGERNALVLRGGLAEGWESHGYPQRVEIPLGYALTRLHLLSGIAAWGYPYTQSRSPAARLTWRYADGSSEEHVFTDGTEFADWISRHDVPGSRWVDLLAEDSWGQVRVLSVAPEQPEKVIDSLVLESFDNHLAPTFLALTAQLGADGLVATPVPAEAQAPQAPRPHVLIFGGGSSHDFRRWFDAEDTQTLGGLGKIVAYSEQPEELAACLRAVPDLEVLVLCNNQPLSDPDLRQAIFSFVRRGGGLLLVHAATWYNWADWPEYNRELVGGGAHGHEAYGDFAVSLLEPDHPVLAGVPASFTVSDELYRIEPDPAAAADGSSQVLALGRSLQNGSEYPLLWVRRLDQGRILCLTLGHDGAAHQHPAYRQLLENGVRWAGRY